MGHGLPSEVNGFDLYSGKVLSVSTLTAVVLAPLLLEHDDLSLFPVLDNASGHSGTRNQRGADLNRSIGRSEEHFRERDLVADLTCERLDAK